MPNLTFQKRAFCFGIKVFNHCPSSIKNFSHELEQFKPPSKSFFLEIHFTHWMNILIAI
jgi:hypothetical protein